MPPRQTGTTTVQKISTVHRVSIGLIAVSLSLTSLALGTALFVSPAANYLFVPGTVQLASAPSSATAVTLTWTAPGDDGSVGQAASYDIRYATSPITPLSFSTATVVASPPAPAPAGTTESYTVTNLQPSTTYFFALTATDAAGNVSAMSNVATKTTSALPVACTPTYTCSDWSVCTNSIMSRTCEVNNGCASGLDAPITQQSCTMPVVAAPAPGTTATPPSIGGEPVSVVKHYLVAGLGPGTAPVFRVIDPIKKKAIKEVVAFNRADRNGVNVTAGDITGDHLADVLIGTGAGTDPLVKLFTTGGQQIAQFNPYPTEKKTGVAVATGDVNGDGVDELLTVPAKSSAQVRVWKYDPGTKRFSQIAQVFAYDRASRQGFSITAGDMDADGRAEIGVTARANARSVIILRLDTANVLQTVKRFTPFPVQFNSGMTIAMGDVLGTGRASLVVTSGPGYYTHVKLFDIRGKEQNSFIPLSKTIRTGMTLTTMDVNADGRAEIVMSSYRAGDMTLRLYRYNGVKKKFEQIQNYAVYPRQVTNGLRLGGT